MQDLSLASAPRPSTAIQSTAVPLASVPLSSVSMTAVPTSLRAIATVDNHDYSQNDKVQIPAFSDVISAFSHHSEAKKPLGHEEPNPTIIALPLQLSWQLKNAINNSTNTKEKRKQKER